MTRVHAPYWNNSDSNVTWTRVTKVAESGWLESLESLNQWLIYISVGYTYNKPCLFSSGVILRYFPNIAVDVSANSLNSPCECCSIQRWNTIWMFWGPWKSESLSSSARKRYLKQITVSEVHLSWCFVGAFPFPGRGRNTPTNNWHSDIHF